MGTQGYLGTSGNFQFLEEHDAVFLQLAFTADLITSENSAAALLKRTKAERAKLIPKKKTRKK